MILNAPQHPLDVTPSEIEVSSGSHAWQGFGVAQRRNRCCDAVEMSAGHAAHLVVIHTAGDEKSEQQRGGVTHHGQPAIGQCNVLPAEEGLNWAWQSATPPRSLHLWLYPEFLDEVAQDASDGRAEAVGVRHGFDETDNALHLFACMLAECLTEPEWCILRAESIAFHAAVHLMDLYGVSRFMLRHASTRPLDPAAMRRVHEFIHDNLSEPLRLIELSEIAGLSRGHFSRAFRLACGMSPHRYVVAARIEKALAMLVAGRSPIDVAHSTGFADQSHLTRWLKDATGMTPGEVKRAGSASVGSWRFAL